MKPVPGHPTYGVNIKGEVCNLRTGNPLKPRVNNKGYLRVCIEKKEHLVHRLVAQAYLPNLDSKPQVNHRNGIKTENHLFNLEWATAQENADHYQKKLMPKNN